MARTATRIAAASATSTAAIAAVSRRAARNAASIDSGSLNRSAGSIAIARATTSSIRAGTGAATETRGRRACRWRYWVIVSELSQNGICPVSRKNASVPRP